MRILVAGGAGFVGSNLCRRLVALGHHTIAVDNMLTGATDNVADLMGSPRFTLLPVDVASLDPGDVEVDVVLHLASPASPVDYDRFPLETLAVNSTGTRVLLDVARHNSARFVLASTSEVYGDPLVHPQPETYWGNVDPIGPRACYDEGKRFGEALVTSYRRVYGVRAAIVRIFNTYGPAMRRNDGRAIPELLEAAFAGRPLPVHEGGRQSRSFMYVDDLVTAWLALVEDDDLDGQVLNVGNPEELTILDLARTIIRLTRSRSPIEAIPGRPGDPQRRRPDITRIRERYGWQPTVSLEDGLTRTIEWMNGSPPIGERPTIAATAGDRTPITVGRIP